MSKKDKGVSRRQLLMGWRESWRESWKQEEREDEKRAEEEKQVQDEVSAKLTQAREAHMNDDLQTAADLYREALKGTPGDEDARRDLGVCLYHMGQYIQARVEFDRVLYTLKRDNTSSLYLGLCLLYMGKPDKAAAAWHNFEPRGEEDQPMAALLQQHAETLAQTTESGAMEAAITDVSARLPSHEVAA